MWANGRVAANAAVFHINWEDMQLNLPNLFAPGEFYVANVGGATSSGVELELNARVHPNVDVFGGFGYTKATFKDDSISGGIAVGGNTIPNTPDYTASLGIQLSRTLAQGLSLYGRAEATLTGAFEYDDPHPEPGRVFTGKLQGRGPRAPRVRRGLDQKRLRHRASRSHSRTVPWRRRGLLVKWEDPGRLVFRQGWAFERSKVNVQSREVSEKHNELVVSS